VVCVQGRFRFRVAAALALALAVLFACFGCQDGYPIPASQCDRWCDASKLTFCSSYDPAGCVLTCSQRGGDAPACRAELDTLLACLGRQSPHELECETYIYEGAPAPPCLDEESDYEVCTVPYALGGYGTLHWR